jgi:hypothetical protein
MREIGDRLRVIEVLTREFQFRQAHAGRAYDRLARQPAVYAAFLTWLEQRGPYPALTVEGFSVERLVREYRMQAPGAFLTLAWLAESPDEARAALAEGYDKLV